MFTALHIKFHLGRSKLHRVKKIWRNDKKDGRLPYGYELGEFFKMVSRKIT